MASSNSSVVTDPLGPVAVQLNVYGVAPPAGVEVKFCSAKLAVAAKPVSYTHLTLPPTPYV